MTPEKRLELIPPSYRATYLAAMSGRSRAKGVKAFCQGCVGYERKSVRNCTDPGCSLYPYRPYQNRVLEEEEVETGEEEVKTDDAVEEEEIPVVEEPVVPKKAKKKKKASSKVPKKKTPPVTTTKTSKSTKKKKKSRFKNRTRK